VRALVTGGAGFIGSHLTDALLASGHEVTVVDDFSTGRRENLPGGSGHLEVIEGSILDPGLVDECMRSADVCFHLASAVGVQLILDRPIDSMYLNVHGTENVVSAARRHRRRLLFTSSSEVYGKQSGGGLAEDSDTVLGAPSVLRWSYAIAKLYGEALVNAREREGEFEGIVVRLFNTVGPRQLGSYGMVLPRFVGQALRGEPLSVYGDGTQKRCFTHVADAVEALLGLIESDRALGGTFNVGSEREVMVGDLARVVVERSKSPSEISQVPYEQAYGEDFEELGRRHPDLTAIREAVGWSPKRSLNEIVDDTITYERKHARSGGEAVPIT
jgi:UDP-glucose 4-epimerase